MNRLAQFLRSWNLSVGLNLATTRGMEKIVDLDCRDIQNPDCMSYEAIWVVDGKYGIA